MVNWGPGAYLLAASNFDIDEVYIILIFTIFQQTKILKRVFEVNDCFDEVSRFQMGDHV